MTTRRQARQDWDWDRAFDACMKEEKQRILDLLEQGDTPEQIIKAYDNSSVVRAVVEAIVEDLQNENKQRQDERA